MNTSRREFILCSVSGMVALTLGCGRSGKEATLESLLNAFYGKDGLSTVKEVGRTYSELESLDMTRLDVIRKPVLEQIQGKTVSECIQYFDQLVAYDFANGQTLSVEGWLLSETELRLAALAYWGAREATPSDKI